jgi:hypothetical protein
MWLSLMLELTTGLPPVETGTTSVVQHWTDISPGQGYSIVEDGVCRYNCQVRKNSSQACILLAKGQTSGLSRMRLIQQVVQDLECFVRNLNRKA